MIDEFTGQNDEKRYAISNDAKFRNWRFIQLEYTNEHQIQLNTFEKHPKERTKKQIVRRHCNNRTK